MKAWAFLLRCVRLLVGLFLLPACWGGLRAVGEVGWAFLGEHPAFLWGALAYLLLFAVFQKPVRTYVLGHEMTHAMGVILFRGRVKEVTASASGGSVRADKENLFITLAPYFLPIYAMAILLLWKLLSLFWDLNRFQGCADGAVGFAWIFHAVLTVSVGIRGQAEMRRYGFLLSASLILLLNAAVLILLMVFLSDDLSPLRSLGLFWNRVLEAYAAVACALRAALY